MAVVKWNVIEVSVIDVAPQYGFNNVTGDDGTPGQFW
jgi:hypothetical protein